MKKINAKPFKVTICSQVKKCNVNRKSTPNANTHEKKKTMKAQVAQTSYKHPREKMSIFFNLPLTAVTA